MKAKPIPAATAELFRANLDACVDIDETRIREDAQAMKAVDDAHAALDECGLIPPRSTSHRSLADRIRAAITAAGKGRQ